MQVCVQQRSTILCNMQPYGGGKGEGLQGEGEKSGPFSMPPLIFFATSCSSRELSRKHDHHNTRAGTWSEKRWGIKKGQQRGGRHRVEGEAEEHASGLHQAAFRSGTGGGGDSRGEERSKQTRKARASLRTTATLRRDGRGPAAALLGQRGATQREERPARWARAAL